MHHPVYGINLPIDFASLVQISLILFHSCVKQEAQLQQR